MSERSGTANGEMRAQLDFSQRTVLIISKRHDERERLTAMFDPAGYVVEKAENVVEAEQILSSRSVELVIFEASHLADAPFDFCLKASARRLPPLIIISEDSGRFEEIIALEIGADAFLQRPADQRLLLAKSKALLRRYSKQVLVEDVSARSANENWHLNSNLLEATSPTGKTVNLPPIQFRLFKIFLDSPGKTFTQEDLAAMIGSGYRKSRHITTSMSRLRRNLASICDVEPIRTVHRIGYVYSPINADL